jgi:phage repressor protein C with HTH and peptisase S24 domain
MYACAIRCDLRGNAMNNRIRVLRKFLDLTQNEFAIKLGMSLAGVQKWERGGSEMKESSLRLLENTFGLNPNWLRRGYGDMFDPSMQLHTPWDSSENVVQYVFRSDVCASAGIGYINETEHEFEIIRIDETIAQRLGVGKNIEIIKIKGDSMEPKYSNGDLVFVDHQANSFTSEGIYVIIYMGTLMVKYLQRIKGGVKIRSLNRALYDDIDMTSEEFSQEDIFIVGRVKGAITFN